MLMYAKAGVPRNAVAMRETEGEGDRERASCGGLLFSLLARVTDCYISFLAGRVQQWAFSSDPASRGREGGFSRSPRNARAMGKQEGVCATPAICATIDTQISTADEAA